MQCDPSIKAIILQINAEQKNDIVIEDIDDEHVLIKTAKHQELKRLLNQVRLTYASDLTTARALIMGTQRLEDSVRKQEESESE